MNMRVRILLMALLLPGLVWSLQGCGYQLRGGTTTLPSDVGPIHIEGFAAHSRIRRQLEQALQDAGASIAADREGADALLRIDDHRSSLHVLSVDRDTRAQEYELRESIRFSFESLRTGRSVPEQQLHARRIFNRERSKATREEAEQRDEMRADLFRRLVNRLTAQL